MIIHGPIVHVRCQPRSLIGRALFILVGSTLFCGCGESPHIAAFNKGVEHYNNRRYEEAIRYFEEALDRKKGDARTVELLAYAYRHKGTNLYRQKDFDKAIAACRVALSYKSDYAEAYYWIAWSQLSKRSYWGAVSSFEKAIRLDPHDARFYEGLEYAKALRADQAKETAKAIAKGAAGVVVDHTIGRVVRWLRRR